MKRWLFNKGTVWLMIFIVGPLALPLLWLSPNFGRGTKIGLTAALVLLTFIMIYGSVILLDNLSGTFLNY